MTIRLPSTFPALLCALSLTAHGDPVAQRYACDDGSHLDIAFFADNSGRPQARLEIAGQALLLPMVPAGSGALYRQGDTRLHTKGDEALFEDGQQAMRRCSRGQAPAVANRPAPAAASSFLDLHGSVSYRTRQALSPDAILDLRIRDGAGRTLVEQRYELAGAQPPIAFTATVDRDLIGKKPRLTISARLQSGGKLRLAGSKTYRTLPADHRLDLVLKPVAGR